ncbi:MAG TPA: hypothetical protein VJB89_01540 [Candidatus Nanoarchaeia archaeon]|nr:hypothetical protein [Candidatus Nanoarchaeia archaeon]
MNKKGDSTWISAVLYFGIGIIIISILLAAGTPVVNRIRDKNTILQTKETMSNLDDNIREAIRGGPGAQRVVNLDLSGGEFNIDPFNDLVYWKYDSKVLLGDVCDQLDSGDIVTVLTDCEDYIVNEGTLKQVIVKSTTSDPYTIYIILDYNEVDLDGNSKPTVNLLLREDKVPTITGLTKLNVKNPGATCEDSDDDTDPTYQENTWLCKCEFDDNCDSDLIKYPSVEFLEE